MQKNTEDTYCPVNRKDWRKWLKENHQSRQSVWLVQYKVSSGKTNLTWSEAVEEALCFGWIDSVRKTLDAERFIQFFCRRKPNSTWSKINKDKVVQLIKKKQMTKAGHESIKVAKQNGSWIVLDQVHQLVIPEDLEKAFLKIPGSRTFFQNLSTSNKKIILAWIVLAKRTETRKKRIAMVAKLAGKKSMPEQFR